MFGFRDGQGRVRAAFTDRHGGVSGGPYATLNLGYAAGDEPAAVTENLRRVADAFGVPAGRLARMSQVHGADVVSVEEPLGEPAVADGLVTTHPGLALCTRAADCVPVLLADPGAEVVGAAHAGRRGLVAGVVPAVAAAMRAAGATNLIAWVGPYVCGLCYEVPPAMQAEVVHVVPQARAQTRQGTAALDIGAGVRAQLARAECRVVDAAVCTAESPDLYSHRRDGPATGRFGGVVMVGS